MLPEVGETAGEGSPQKSAGVPANTRERAKKKANRERLTFVYWWSWRLLNHLNKSLILNKIVNVVLRFVPLFVPRC